MRNFLLPAVLLVALGAGCAPPTPSTVDRPPSTAPTAPPAAGRPVRSAAGFSGTVLAGSSAPLLDFTKADFDAALASDKLVVLYFYANWCPICRVEFPMMQEAFDQLDTDRVIGFRVNYKDSETDADEEALAREHGVPYQHTKVFIKNGKRILKAPDSWDTARYLKEIKAAS